MDMKIKNKISILFVTVITASLTLGLTGCAKSVGKQISKDKFKEFYYTYSTTVNPPEFQRYRFYMEDGKVFFYHEKERGIIHFLQRKILPYVEQRNFQMRSGIHSGTLSMEEV